MRIRERKSEVTRGQSFNAGPRRGARLSVALFAIFGSLSLPAGAAAPDISKKNATDILPEGAQKKRRSFGEGEALNWDIGAGGSLVTGNTQSWTMNAGTNFLFETGPHALSFTALANLEGLNESPADPDSPYDTTVKKIFATLGYDWYFTHMNGVWASLVERWDPLAGFDTQFVASGGYLRAFIREENHLFTGRVGYAYTFSAYSEESTAGGGSESIQGLIAALNYENSIRENVEFLASVAYLINITPITKQDAAAWEDSRVAFNTALVTEIMDNFSFEARFLLLFENKPASDFSLDTTTVASLMYTIW